MPIQAFVDESGCKGQGTHLVLAGFISPAEKWVHFADEWRDCLAQSPRIRQFKMTEARGIKGEFHGLSETQRNDKLSALVAVINRNVESSICAGLILKDHEELLSKVDKPLNEVYFWLFLSIILGVAFDLADGGQKEKFEISFDEQCIFGPRARDWYPVTKDFVAKPEPAAHAIMPAHVMFRDDDEFLPLQAADLLAGCIRLNLSPDGESFEWLLAQLTKVRRSPFSSIDDKQSMQNTLNYALNWEEPLSIELYEKCQALLGKFRKDKKKSSK